MNAPIVDLHHQELCRARHTTLDGGYPPYIHGQVHHFIDDWKDILLSNNEYELLDQEEVEKYVKENKQNEENN